MKSAKFDNQTADPINELDIPTPDLDALMKLSQPGPENDSTMPRGKVTAKCFADPTEISTQTNPFRNAELESLLARLGPLPPLPNGATAASESLTPQDSNIQ